MDANPFANAGASDAFADPSVAAAATSQVPQYAPNPFDQPAADGGYGAMEVPSEEDKKKKKKGAADETKVSLLGKSSGGPSPLAASIHQHSGSGSRSPPRVAPQQQPEANNFAGVSEQDLALREAQLNRREQALQEKEQALNRKEEEVKATGQYQRNNWPFPCYPVTYHDISDEVKPEHRVLCRKFYAALLFTWLCLFWNWIVFCAAWGTNSDDGTGFVWASIYLATGSPGAWKLWYRPIYYGLGGKGTMTWMMFFITYLAHIGFVIVMGLGIPSCAAAGLFWMFKAFADGDNLGGIFSLVSTGTWGINLLCSVYLIKRAHDVWKGDGGPDKLKKEAARQAVQASMDNGGSLNGGPDTRV